MVKSFTIDKESRATFLKLPIELDDNSAEVNKVFLLGNASDAYECILPEDLEHADLAGMLFELHGHAVEDGSTPTRFVAGRIAFSALLGAAMILGQPA